MSSEKISKYKRDCFAFEDKSYTNSIGRKIVVIQCKILNRDNCIKCSFYKNRKDIDENVIEFDIQNYNPDRR